MTHWEVTYLSPGFYSVARGSNAGVRQFAVPLTKAAEHVAREREPQAEMYPDAYRLDLTPFPVVAIDDVEELEELEAKAIVINEQLPDEAAILDRELVAV